jgi:cytochrome c553
MMMRAAALLMFLSLAPAAAHAADDAGVAFFESRIRPVLVQNCYECHSAEAKKLKGALRVDLRAELLKGGENGPAIVPGKPTEGTLLKAIRHQDGLEMPPKKKLPDAVIADFEKWIFLGAPDPRGEAPAAAGVDLAAARQNWAFQRPAKVLAPDVEDPDGWCRNEIDRFMFAKLVDRGVKPAKQTDKRTLIRRLTFDLTGLPPTDAAVEAFVADNTADAFDKVVDRLLASPAYGERWGRHWLDVVRYTDLFDTRSLKGDAGSDVPFAWRYRDWVIDALNRDLPYDQFIKQQIAGDLLADKKAVVATGVYVIGEWGGGDADKEKMLTDIVDDQVDVTGRAFLGLTLACARCHDHKFDPISADDYYGLAGIFFSSHIIPTVGAKTAGSPVLRIPIVDPEGERQKRDAQKQAEQIAQELDAAICDQIITAMHDMRERKSEYLLAAWDYLHRPAAEKEKSIARFAAERKLNAFAVRRWTEVIEHPNDPLGKPLSERVAAIAGNKNFNGWRNPGPSGTPNAIANSGDQPIRHLTFVVPPHGVALHPSPSSGAAVIWTPPADVKAIHISGKISDADDKCGDGFAWRLSSRGEKSRDVFATGDVPNGIAEFLPMTAAALAPGNSLELAIFPKGNYGCDTTVVELKVEENGGAKRVWNISSDLSPDIHAIGRAGTPAEQWRLEEVPLRDLGLPIPPDTAIGRWLARARAADVAREELVKGAASLPFKLNHDQTEDAELGRMLSDSPGPFWRGAKDDAAFSPMANRELAPLKERLDAARKKADAATPMAHGLQEGGVPGTIYTGFHDSKLLIRGRYDRPGEIVTRHFPRVLAGDAPSAIPEKSSGRLQLAEWIASPENPLTARVMVNRIWQHHFGEGIVRTPNNFGKLGTPPTHPELLDWLAERFVAEGWSIKAMHRLIVHSAAYQQASGAEAEVLAMDPDNLLWGRQSRQRLDSEALRDALLAAAGSLDPTIGGPPVPELESPRRTIYLRTIRSDRATYRMLFDAADPQTIVEKRTESTVGPQALFLLNNPFTKAQAKKLGELAKQQNGDDGAKIDWLYRRLYARPPTEEELKIGQTVLPQWRAADGDEWATYAQLLLCANEFMYVD